MTYHILNGDCLAEQLKNTSIKQNLIICRECLIDGEVKAKSLSEFWIVRAQFMEQFYDVSFQEYEEKSIQEIEKITAIPDNAEVCLWFENDLFCQVNMWFVLSLLAENTSLQIYRVFPQILDPYEQWKGFGMSDASMLEDAYSAKVVFTPQDITLGTELWKAFQDNKFDVLLKLSKTHSHCFQYLEEVCKAHMERFLADGSLGRPERVLKEIMETKSRHFPEVFAEFSIQEGIYGFGDLQLKALYDKVKQISK